MSDEELFRWLGFDRNGVDPESAKRYMSSLSPERRVLFDRMRAIELWDNGFGPKPDLSGVLLDYDRPEKNRP